VNNTINMKVITDAIDNDLLDVMRTFALYYIGIIICDFSTLLTIDWKHNSFALYYIGKTVLAILLTIKWKQNLRSFVTSDMHYKMYI